MTTPALQRLREHFPDALIALVTPEKLRGLWLQHPAIDEIIGFKPDEGPWQVARKIQVLMWPDTQSKRNAANSEKRAFDLAVVLPNSPRSALETWLARIPCRIGYARRWRNFFLTTTVPNRPDAVEMRKRTVAEVKKLAAGAPDSVSPVTLRDSAHQIHDYLHLVSMLGASPDPVPPQIVVTPEETKAAAQKFNLTTFLTGNRPVFGLNPGAEYGPAKRWPAERFVAAAREIQKRTNCLWVILGGKGDAHRAGEIESALHTPHSAIVNLAGTTSLRELCALVKLCRVVLTNDTGPMHIAAALGIPVVVPFGSTSPELTGPILSGNVRHQLLKSDAPCSPCFLRECPIDFRCMNGITVERVVEAVLKTAS
jgi:heptosyltransferase-2